MLTLDESLFTEIVNTPEKSNWTEVATKQVADSDGFMTDYTWYTNGDEHICVFGDKEVYTPENTTPDVDGFFGAEGAEAMAAWFASYNGIDDDNDSEMLHESFSASIPSWLLRELERNKDLRLKLARQGYDLEKMKYISVPKSSIPTSTRDPIFHDAKKQLVYLLRDDIHNIVYLPGLSDDNVSVTLLTAGVFSTRLKYLSRSQLLQLIVFMGYIEDDTIDTTRQLRQTRKDLQTGRVVRGPGQFSYVNKYYPNKADGYTDWDNPLYEVVWNLTRGQDKSGYKLDPNKYVAMLAQADMQTYGRQLERYSKKLTTLRLMIVDYMISIDVKNRRRTGFHHSLNDVIRYFEEAMSEYSTLQEEIERILQHDNLTDEEKNTYISSLFDATSWGTIYDLNNTLKRAMNELKIVKEEDKKFAEVLAAKNVQQQDSLSDTEIDAVEKAGLTTEELKTFISEEVQEGETLIEALDRYIEEIGCFQDSEHDLSLTEGVVKSIITAAKEVGGKQQGMADLRRQLRELVADLQHLTKYDRREIGAGGVYSSLDEYNEAVEELENLIHTKKLELEILSDAEDRVFRD